MPLTSPWRLLPWRQPRRISRPAGASACKNPAPPLGCRVFADLPLVFPWFFSLLPWSWSPAMPEFLTEALFAPVFATCHNILDGSLVGQYVPCDFDNPVWPTSMLIFGPPPWFRLRLPLLVSGSQVVLADSWSDVPCPLPVFRPSLHRFEGGSKNCEILDLRTPRCAACRPAFLCWPNAARGGLAPYRSSLVLAL